ncbi:hypothetical protein [uncultured Trichococcus sp.]|uniref:hypothetical protein n=1 Tax=uncultured Trichococcus sp. TaxID=189665 RepID=UPI0025921739|nr:hypothetical protein [uncultured Trichococcus sp.]
MNEIKRTHPASSTGCVLLLLGCLKSTTAAAMAVGHSERDSSRTVEKAAICRLFRVHSQPDNRQPIIQPVRKAERVRSALKEI